MHAFLGASLVCTFRGVVLWNFFSHINIGRAFRWCDDNGAAYRRMLQGGLFSSSQYWSYQEETGAGLPQNDRHCICDFPIGQQRPVLRFICWTSCKGCKLSCSSCLWLFSVEKPGEATLVAHPTACHIYKFTGMFSHFQVSEGLAAAVTLTCCSNTNLHEISGHRHVTFLV